jgi:hypothetical protein
MHEREADRRQPQGAYVGRGRFLEERGGGEATGEDLERAGASGGGAEGVPEHPEQVEDQEVPRERGRRQELLQWRLLLQQDLLRQAVPRPVTPACAQTRQHQPRPPAQPATTA